MKFVIILTLIGLSTADILQLIKRAQCNLNACADVGEAVTDVCGRNGETNYECLCNDMSDSFYEDVYDCGKECLPYDDAGIKTPSDFKDSYCDLADRFGDDGGDNENTLVGLQLASSTTNSISSSTQSTRSTTTSSARSSASSTDDTDSDDSDSEDSSSQSRAHANSNYMVPVFALVVGLIL
ncbi:putative GPI-anchored adhesin-like protein PGA28 [Candida tropicalis]